MPDESGPERPCASLIDHTHLSPGATAQDIERLCREAVEHSFAAVCANPCHLPRVVALLGGHACLPITVVGFPLGNTLTSVKAFEAAQAVELGAREIDMVLNPGALRDGCHESVLYDISEVVRAAGVPVKVILETSLLTDGQKRTACRISVDAGAAFVKTCTGFGGGGATEHDIRLMREAVGPGVGVKASGGIRTLDDARRMIAAGADRLGTSSSVAIVAEAAASAGRPA